MTLNDAANIVELPAELHKGPHSQAYHQWVYNRLQKAKDPVKIQERLKAELQAIAGELKAHPEWLRNPPMQGGR